MDYETLLGFASYGKDSPDICDDSEASIRKFRGALFCMPQYDDADRKSGHKKYKHLMLPSSAQAGPNEEVRDFWLDSELDALMNQPAPTSLATPSGHITATRNP